MAVTDTSALRGQLAERAESASGGSTAVERADRPKSPSQAVREAIEKQAASFSAVLPKHVDPQRFGRLVLTAVKSAPELMQCFGTPQGQTSVLLAAMQAAAIGLEPNTPTQECWLLPRKNKGVWECQLQIGYRGWQKLARRSGTVKTLFAEVVRERDEFTWSRGLEEDTLHHKPFDGDGEPGELTHAYCVVRFTNGGYNFIVLNRRQVEQRRAMSDSWRNEKARPYSPWSKWPEAMWRKSAVKALVPFMDLSPEAEQALGVDDGSFRWNPDEGAIDVEAVGWDQPEPPAEIEASTGEIVGVDDGEPSEEAEQTVVDPDNEPEPVADQEPLHLVQSQPGEPMTADQSKAMHALLRKVHNAAGPDRFPVLTKLLGREITSTKELSKAEASRVIDLLQNGEAPEPAADGEEDPF